MKHVLWGSYNEILIIIAASTKTFYKVGKAWSKKGLNKRGETVLFILGTLLFNLPLSTIKTISKRKWIVS